MTSNSNIPHTFGLLDHTGYQQYERRKAGSDPLDELETYVPSELSEKEIPVFAAGFGARTTLIFGGSPNINSFSWKPASADKTSVDFGDDQAFFLEDLHHIESRLDSSPISAALENAFELKSVTYGQASELRQKIASALERYSDKFQKQQALHDLVIGQVRCCRDHLERLSEAETVPRKLKQQLQGLRGDTRRLNDELEKSKLHLIRLQEEIEQLENDKEQLHATLEKIPTHQELRHLVTCWHLEQQVMFQQVEHYRATINTTASHIRDNETILLKITGRVKHARAEVLVKQNEMGIISNRIPRIQMECAQLESETGKITDEAQTLKAVLTRLQEVLETSRNAIDELHKEAGMVLDGREVIDTEFADRLEQYKSLMRTMKTNLDEEASFKDENATLEQKITDLDALMRGASHGRLSCLRERDRLSAVKRNLDVETRRITGQNKSDKDFVDKMLRQATELENEANQHREQIIDLGTVINAYGSQGTKRRKKNIGLYRDAREKFKDRFSTFMQLKKMSKSQKKLEERVIRMKVEQRSASLERGKLSRSLGKLQEDSQQKGAAHSYGTVELSEKTRNIEDMQSEYYALDRDRQELRKLLSLSQGGVHEHKDRMTCLNDELKWAKEDFGDKVRQLENAQHGRNSLWTSLLRVRKAHSDEREKLKDYEERFERGFSRVLLLRKDLDIILLKCETFTETFELVSELRACEASLLIDITTQFMLKHVENNQIVKATHEVELRHRALDSYVEWLHKAADTDVKLLYKRLKWHGSLVSKYTTTRKKLRKQLLKTVQRRLLLTDKVVECKESTLLRFPTINPTDLLRKEEMLNQMLITMEQRYFQQSIRLSFLNTICREMDNSLESRKSSVVADKQERMSLRIKAERLDRQGKLTLLDVAAARKRLCDELVLSDSLQTMKQLASENFVPSLTAENRLQVAYHPENAG